MVEGTGTYTLETLMAYIAVPLITERYAQIFTFPLDNPDLIPSLIPLFVGLFVMEVYFGKYKDERLGWNSAVSNSILLIATGLSIIWTLGLPETTNTRFVAAAGITLLGMVILLFNFWHLWPQTVAFEISSSFLTYTLAYIALAAAYADMPYDINTAIAGFLAMLTFYLFFAFLKSLE